MEAQPLASSQYKLADKWTEEQTQKNKIRYGITVIVF